MCQVALDVQDIHAMFPRHVACLAGEFVDANSFREAEGRVPGAIDTGGGNREKAKKRWRNQGSLGIYKVILY